MSPETRKVFEAIEVLLKEYKISADVTKIGRVIEILANNKYKVQIYDKVYAIKSQFHYDVNEKVWVLFPQGRDNPNDLYIYPNQGGGGSDTDIVISSEEPDPNSDAEIWIQY